MCSKNKDAPDPETNAALAVQKPRRNGWSWPPHPFQFLAWFFLLFFGFVHFVVLVPVMPAEWQIAGYVVVGIILGLHCILHIWSLSINPADDNVIRKWKGLEPKRYDRTLQAHVIENNRCYICDTDVCASAKHCRLCNKCVSGFDHHCRWLNSCIGEKNYRLFISCLVSALVGAILILAVTVYIIVMYFHDPSALHYAQQGILVGNTDPTVASDVPVIASTMSVNGTALPTSTPVQSTTTLYKYYIFAEVPGAAFISVVILTTVLCLVAIGLLGHLLCFHIYLNCIGLSTYEYIVEMREQQERQLEEIQALKELGYFEEKDWRYYMKRGRQLFMAGTAGCKALVIGVCSGSKKCLKNVCCQTNVVHPDQNGQTEDNVVAANDKEKDRSPREGHKASGSSPKVAVQKAPVAAQTDRAPSQPPDMVCVQCVSQPGKPASADSRDRSKYTCAGVCNKLSTYDYIMRGREKAKKSTPESSMQNLKGNKVAPVAVISRDQGLHESMENGYVPDNGYHHGGYDPNSSDEDTRAMQRQYEEVLMEDEALSPRLTARSSGRRRPKSSERELHDREVERPRKTKLQTKLPPITPVASLVQQTAQVASTHGKRKRKRRVKSVKGPENTSVSSENKRAKKEEASKQRKVEVAAIAANGTYTPRGYHINQKLPSITPSPTPQNDVITPACPPSPYHSSSAESLQEIPLSTIRNGYEQLPSPRGSPNPTATEPTAQKSHSKNKRRKAKPKERRPRPQDVPPLELTNTVTDGEYSMRSDVTTAQSGRLQPVLHMATSDV